MSNRQLWQEVHLTCPLTESSLAPKERAADLSAIKDSGETNGKRLDYTTLNNGVAH
jgi:hypothetical protein